MKRTGLATVSMLRTWLVRISPATGKPGGSTTLEPKWRIVVVIGQTMAKAEAAKKAPGYRTRAGPRPLCSRPTRGSKSVQIRSPASEL